MVRTLYNFNPRTGQQAYFRPHGLSGRFIALVRGPMSHVGTIIVTDGRVLVSEQVANGSQLWPLSAYIATGSDIAIRDLPTEHVGPDGWRERLEEFAWQTWGVWKYSMPKLRRHLIYAILGNDPIADASWLDEFTDEVLVKMVVKMICSERGSFDLRRFALWDVLPGLSDRAATPWRLYQSPRLVTLVEHAQIVEA